MPWLATIRTPLGWLLSAVCFLLMLDVSRSMPVLQNGLPQVFAAAVLTLVIVAWKALGNTLWLACDAHALRLPGIEHDADYALVAYLALTIIVPALALGLLFGSLFAWLVLLALVATATLAFCLLPTALALPAFSIALFLLLLGVWHPALPGNSAFLTWAVPVVIALAVIAQQRWSAIRRAPSLATSAWMRPAAQGGRVVQLRRLHGNTFRATADGVTRSPRRSTPAVHGVGPEHPIRSLRTVLGWRLMPLDACRTPVRYHRLLLLFMASLLCLPATAWLARQYFGATAIVQFAPQLVLLIAILLTSTAASRNHGALRWNGLHAELPLLALMPHLDRRAVLRRHLVLACLAHNTLARLWFAVGIALILAVLRLPAMFYAYTLLAFMGGLILECAIVAHALGGRPLPHWIALVLYFTVLIPVVLVQSWGMRVVTTPQPQLDTGGVRALVCVAVWLLWCGGLVLLAWRGWRALQQRPHPFLSNTPV